MPTSRRTALPWPHTSQPPPGHNLIPSQADGERFLPFCERMLERFGPDVMLTRRELDCPALMERTQSRGIPIVLRCTTGLMATQACFVMWMQSSPSRFAAEEYRRTIGITATPLAGPWDWSRVPRRTANGVPDVCEPEPNKGVFWFVRIASELGRLRPTSNSLLSKAGAPRLNRTGLDLTHVSNLNVMENTPDPAHFYR